MASKLRRTPLFGYDGNLGIPLMPPNSANSSKVNNEQQTKSKYEYRHHSKVGNIILTRKSGIRLYLFCSTPVAECGIVFT